MKIMLIFVDGWSHASAKKYFPSMNDKNSSSVVPGIGFSNNLYPEMLCGTNPDEIGYFNEWSPVPKPRGPLSLLIRSLDIFRPFLYINAGIRKIILRKFLKLDYANIPFKYAHLFKPQGSHDFRDLSPTGILGTHKFKIFDSVEFRDLKVGERDLAAIELTKRNMSNDNILVSLVDLDNVAHIHGCLSSEYDRHATYLAEEISDLARAFCFQNEDNRVFLFSDHGMVDVTDVKSFDIESVFGPMAEDKYLYFVDSTYVRVWVKDDSLRDELAEFLNELNFGTVVQDEERIRHGVTRLEYGDYLFRANEGVMLVPNFYGGRPCRAMHGYDGNLESQRAIFADLSGSGGSYELPKSSKGVYQFLLERLA
jgi:hypothetical protein